MKKLRSCFLFQKQAEKNPALFWLWNWLFLLAAGVGLGVTSLLLAFGHYEWAYFFSYFRHPLIVVLNLLPILLALVFLYLLIGRAWIAFLITAVPVFLASAGNFFKLLFRDDPFLFADMDSIFMALRLTGGGDHYTIRLDTRLIFCIAFIVLATAFLFFFVRGRIRTRNRLIGAAVALLCFIPLRSVLLDQGVYDLKTENYDVANRWSATQVYVSKGFVYPFIHSIPAAFPEKPAGYSDAAALEILHSYASEDIPQERKIDVIAIQLEAFNDLTHLGLTDFTLDPYEAYHALEKESLTGTLLTNIFAGGTVDTERCFATGFPAVDNFRRDTGSYVRYFNEQGYYTEGSHTCYNWFYNRLNINKYLGFQNYYYYEDRYGAMANGDVAFDNVLLPDILALYRDRDKAKPYFSFSVTYQGHGPYGSDVLYWKDICWDGPRQSEETYYILNNYLASVKDTGERLAALVDELRAEERPILFVAFGDHNPWLGNNNSVYDELGINLDTSTQEGFVNYYGTRYLIWANDAAKALLGNDFVGEGPTLSPCFLMNLIFDEAGLGKGSSYMQAAEKVYSLAPVVSTTGAYVENGLMTREPSQPVQDAMAQLRILQYYRKRHPEW